MMMMNKAFFCFLALLIYNPLTAQETLLSEYVTDPEADNTGPNEIYFHHISYGYGWMFPKLADASSPYKSAFNFSFSSRHKLKITGLLAIGGDLFYSTEGHYIDSKDEGTLFDRFYLGSNRPSDKERIISHRIGSDLFIRVNFDPNRGNYLGYYLDFGAGPSFSFYDKYVNIYKTADGTNIRTRYQPFKLNENLQYHVFGRIAYNFFALKCSYNLAEYFKPEHSVPEPSKLMFSIELNPYSL